MMEETEKWQRPSKKSLEKKLKRQMSSDQNLGYLPYIGDITAQLYSDYNEN